jgi:hypothetical protein
MNLATVRLRSRCTTTDSREVATDMEKRRKFVGMLLKTELDQEAHSIVVLH